MALTKHQRLERAIREFFDRLNSFYAQLSQEMAIFHLQADDSSTMDSEFVEQDTFQTLLQKCSIANLVQCRRNLAILFCPSEEELIKGIPWDAEDGKNTMAHHLSMIFDYEGNRQVQREHLHKKLSQLAFEHFKPFACNQQGHFRHPYSELQAEAWFPKGNMTVLDAYLKIRHALSLRLNRSHDALKIDWKNHLEDLIFNGFEWPKEQKQEIIADLMEKERVSKSTPGTRWNSSHAIDVSLNASFIEYFAQQFLNDPSCKEKGEIICFLWIAIHLSQDPTLVLSENFLLKLTTDHIEGGIVLIHKEKIDLSIGLENILTAYIGKKPEDRSQHLFPNLTPGKLVDRFYTASQVLISDKPPVLPKAFLTFPHGLNGVRMRPSMRKRQQPLFS